MIPNFTLNINPIELEIFDKNENTKLIGTFKIVITKSYAYESTTTCSSCDNDFGEIAVGGHLITVVSKTKVPFSGYITRNITSDCICDGILNEDNYYENIQLKIYNDWKEEPEKYKNELEGLCDNDIPFTIYIFPLEEAKKIINIILCKDKNIKYYEPSDDESDEDGL